MGPVQSIEYMKQFFLAARFIGDELYVIYKEKVQVPVFCPELYHFLILYGFNKFVCKSFGRYIEY